MRLQPPRTRVSRRSGHGKHARGSTLIVTVVLVAVLTVAAAGLVVRSRMGVETAGAARRQEAVLSCAEAAREMLVSRFRVSNINLAELRLERTTGGHRLGSGHYDTFDMQTVEPLGAEALSAPKPQGIGNRVVRTSLGGAPYRVTVVCADSSEDNQQAEVEYLVRFGL